MSSLSNALLLLIMLFLSSLMLYLNSGRYNQSIYCWNVYIKRLGQIICMSVVDMKPQPMYENPIVKIDGVCFTYHTFITLFYFILFYFILFYFILFYFILFYFILFYFILFSFSVLLFLLSSSSLKCDLIGASDIRFMIGNHLKL